MELLRKLGLSEGCSKEQFVSKLEEVFPEISQDEADVLWVEEIGQNKEFSRELNETQEVLIHPSSCYF